MTLVRQLAAQFGLAQLNTLTKYPSILTLHALGERGALTGEHTTPDAHEVPLYPSEKIDGTNCRLLFFADGSYLIGGRETFLCASGDLIGDPNNGIVEGLRRNLLTQDTHSEYCLLSAGGLGLAPLTVVYGEFYGGKVNDHKQYGSGCFGFRVFDVAVFDEIEELFRLLELPPAELSLWRESTAFEGGMQYGQPFLNQPALANYCRTRNLPAVPGLGLPVTLDAGWDHAVALAYLRDVMGRSEATLSPDAKGNPEGVVLASADRRIRLKLRFEDYEKTLRLAQGQGRAQRN